MPSTNHHHLGTCPRPAHTHPYIGVVAEVVQMMVPKAAITPMVA